MAEPLEPDRCICVWPLADVADRDPACPMHRRLTLQELHEKIDWEGGILETVDYGIRPDQMPTEPLRAAWTTLVTAHAALESARRAVDLLLGEGS
jgi:hypothetical protein